jgi:hypothetical protein
MIILTPFRIIWFSLWLIVIILYFAIIWLQKPKKEDDFENGYARPAE